MKRTCCGINFQGGSTKINENKVQSGDLLAWISKRTQIFKLLTSLFSHENRNYH
jgi:hypothetical protein